jgi:hypothetical protein
MKLKAIGVAAIAALALSGIFASGAAAEIVLSPSAQEMAEHPGEGYSATCQMSEAESRESQFTDQYINKANAEGKCTGEWFAELPLAQAGQSTLATASRSGARQRHRARHARHRTRARH